LGFLIVNVFVDVGEINTDLKRKQNGEIPKETCLSVRVWRKREGADK